ncbi:MAG: hypothetical protein IPP60_16095 [Sphingobacteriales bacterium]|nr:hypothetical protein [Sphingobacteriales bacterium]
MRLERLYLFVCLFIIVSCNFKKNNNDIIRFGNSLVLYPDRIDSVFNKSRNINVKTYSNNLLNEPHNIKGYSGFFKKYNKKCIVTNSSINIRDGYVFSEINIRNFDSSLSIDMYFKRLKTDSVWQLIDLGFSGYDVQ